MGNGCCGCCRFVWVGVDECEFTRIAVLRREEAVALCRAARRPLIALLYSSLSSPNVERIASIVENSNIPNVLEEEIESRKATIDESSFMNRVTSGEEERCNESRKFGAS